MLKLKKVYTVSSKNKNKPRLFLQHVVCEAAGFKYQESVYISMNEEKQEIMITNHPQEDAYTVHISGRKSRSSSERRPLLDTAREEYESILNIKQKVEICVYKNKNESKIIIRPLKFTLQQKDVLETLDDQRISLTSICAGAGIGTSAFVDTGYFTPVMEVELEEDSTEVLLHNYPHSYVFNGDIRDINEVAKSDVAFISLPCNEYSSLGRGEEEQFDNLVLAASDVIKATDASVLFFENVPRFFKSNSFHTLKELLSSQYPYWQSAELESVDFGSIARRNRGYAVAFKEEHTYHSFVFPEKPTRLRKQKLRDFLDPISVSHKWREMDYWRERFDKQEKSGNPWKDRKTDKTFLSKHAEEVQCIVKRYKARCVSSSYVIDENEDKWRFFSVNEIRKMLSVPHWFEFPPHTSETRQYEMLGQSVDCRIIKAFANKIATLFYRESLFSLKC